MCCRNIKYEKKGISIHTIPFYDDPGPEAMRIRRRCIEFVQSTDKYVQPKSGSLVISVHFSEDNFLFVIVLTWYFPPQSLYTGCSATLLLMSRTRKLYSCYQSSNMNTLRELCAKKLVISSIPFL